MTGWRERIKGLTVINSVTEYRERLAELEALMQLVPEPEPGTADAARLRLLALQLEDYERKFYPFDPATSSNPIDGSPAAYSKDELQGVLRQMELVINCFYDGARAVKPGFHQLVEFAGFLREYWELCKAATAQGHDFVTGFSPIPPAAFHGHHALYLGEKFGCIFEALFARRPERVAEFCAAAFGAMIDPAAITFADDTADSKDLAEGLIAEMQARGMTFADLLNLPALRRREIDDLTEAGMSVEQALAELDARKARAE